MSVWSPRPNLGVLKSELMGRWKKSEAPHTGGYESAKEREDKAFTLFSEMLIQKLEETKKSEWKQPWFAEGQTAWPK